MADVLAAIVARIKKADPRHDIPYVAGYSQHGETLDVDRRMLRSFLANGRRVQPDRFLILREAVEKALELGPICRSVSLTPALRACAKRPWLGILPFR
jgi:hypothetical protein